MTHERDSEWQRKGATLSDKIGAETAMTHERDSEWQRKGATLSDKIGAERVGHHASRRLSGHSFAEPSDEG
jgi:ribosomal protein S16